MTMPSGSDPTQITPDALDGSIVGAGLSALAGRTQAAITAQKKAEVANNSTWTSVSSGVFAGLTPDGVAYLPLLILRSIASMLGLSGAWDAVEDVADSVGGWVNQLGSAISHAAVDAANAINQLGILVLGVDGAAAIGDVVDAINAAGANFTATVNSLWQGFTGGVVGGVGKTLTDLQTAAAAVSSQASTALTNAATGLTQIGALINSVGGTVINDVGAAINGTIANLNHTWDSIWQGLTGGTATGKTAADVKTATAANASTTNTAATNASTALTNFASLLTAAGQSTVTAVGSALAGAVAGVQNTLDSIWQGLTGGTSTGKSATDVKTAASSNSATTNTAATNAQTALTNFATLLTNAGQATIGAVGTALQGAVTNIQSTLDSIWQGLTGGSATGNTAAAVKTAAASNASTTNTAATNASTALTNFATLLTNAGQSTVAAVGAALSGAVSNIQLGWDSLWQGLTGGTSTGNTAASVKTAMAANTSATNTAGTNASTALTNAGSALTQISSMLTGAAVGTANALGAALAGAVTNIQSTWDSLWQGLTGGTATGQTAATVKTAASSNAATTNTAATNASTAITNAATANTGVTTLKGNIVSQVKRGSNLASDPDMSNPGLWVTGFGNCTGGLATTRFVSSPNALRLVYVGAVGGYASAQMLRNADGNTAGRLAVRGGQKFTFESMVYIETANTTAATAFVQAQLYDSTGVNPTLYFAGNQVATKGVWAKSSGKVTVPATGYDQLDVTMYALNIAVAGDTFWFDENDIREVTGVQSLLNSIWEGLTGGTATTDKAYADAKTASAATQSTASTANTNAATALTNFASLLTAAGQSTVAAVGAALSGAVSNIQSTWDNLWQGFGFTGTATVANVKTAASSVNSTANTAATNASTAITNASTAQSTANTASTNASSALTQLTTLITNAGAATIGAVGTALSGAVSNIQSTLDAVWQGLTGGTATGKAASDVKTAAAASTSATNTAATNASTAITNAATADGKAVAAQGTANTAATNASQALTNFTTLLTNAGAASVAAVGAAISGAVGNIQTTWDALWQGLTGGTATGKTAADVKTASAANTAATTTAGTNASTAITNAATADGKAVAAQGTANTAATNASQALTNFTTLLTNAGQATVAAVGSALAGAVTNIQSTLDNVWQGLTGGTATGKSATDVKTAAAANASATTTAGTNATTAITNAATAQTTANTGVTNAATADGKAVAAQGTANTAATNASTALSNFTTLLTNAGQSTIAAVGTALSGAVAGVQSTLDSIWQGLTGGTASGQTAATVKTAAAANASTTNTASTNASTAITNAAAAQTTANTGVTNAATAQGTANTASTNASTALTNFATLLTNAGQSTIAAVGTALSGAVSNIQSTWDSLWQGLTGGTATGQSAATVKTAAAATASTTNTASTNASTAISNAATAQTTANTGVTNAAAAQSTANTAGTNASTAITNAATANTSISQMITGAAVSTATALGNALSGAVSNIQTTWNSIYQGIMGGTGTGTAANVKTATQSVTSTANTASTNASTGITNAATAQGTANTAVTNAATADGKAVAAQGTANTAATNASTAITNASTAQGTANTAVSNAATADGKAVAAQSTANTASTNASTGITNAAAAQAIADKAWSDILSSPNLSLDGGFETSSYWTAQTSAYAGVSTAQKHSGTQSFKIVSTGASMNYLLPYIDAGSGQVASIGTTGERYYIEVWVFAPATNSGLGKVKLAGEQISAPTYAATFPEIANVTFTSATAGTWQKLSGFYTIPAGQYIWVPMVMLDANDTTAGDVFYVDDFFIVKTPSSVGQANTNSIVTKLSGPVAGGLASQAQADKALKNVASVLADNTAQIQALAAANAQSTNSGASAVVDFSTYADAAQLVSTIWNEVYTGTGTQTFGTQGGQANTYTNASGAIRSMVAIYKNLATTTDTQKVGFTVASQPNTWFAAHGHLYLIGRSNVGGTSYIYVEFEPTQFTLGCVVNGVKTVWTTVQYGLLNTSYYLVCGTSGGSRVYQVWEGSTLLTTYSEVGTTSQLGAAYRYTGFGMLSDYLIPYTLECATLSAWGMADNTPATYKGVVGRVMRTSTSTITLPAAAQTAPVKLSSITGSAGNGSAFFDTVDYVSQGLTFSAGRWTLGTDASLEGLYAVDVRALSSAYGSGAWGYQVLFKNGVAYEGGDGGSGPSFSNVANSQNWEISHWTVYLKPGDYIELGVSQSVNGVTWTGDATGSLTYFKIGKVA